MCVVKHAQGAQIGLVPPNHLRSEFRLAKAAARHEFQVYIVKQGQLDEFMESHWLTEADALGLTVRNVLEQQRIVPRRQCSITRRHIFLSV